MITATVGMSISGSRLTGNELYASAPITTVSSMSIVIKTGCLIDVSEMAIPSSFSGGDMSYPSFLLQVPIVMRINWLCNLALYNATFKNSPKLQDKCNPHLCHSSQAYYTVVFLYVQVG